MPAEYRCPIHHELLTPSADGYLTGQEHGARYPLVDGIPVLLPDEDERRRVIEVDWGGRAETATGSRIDFYNQSRDQKQYCRNNLDRYRNAVERWCGAAAAGPVLEIGSGMGVLQGIGGDYVALDYSLTALKWYINPRYQRVCGTAELLPFPDESFSFVFTIAALEHVPRADQAIAEVARVLKPGGIAYLLPAWHCVQYNCEGIPVRPYRDLTLRQKLVKLSLPVRQLRWVKALNALPRRSVRRALWAVHGCPTTFLFGRLQPDYSRFWMSDSDAAARLDSHEACLYFHSRGYAVLSPGPRALDQLKARHEPVVVQKPGGSI